MTHSFPWLTLLIVLPLAGAVALCVVKESSVRLIALGITAADLLLSFPLWWLFDSSSGGMQFNETALWISTPPIHYRLGLDGISLPLVLMTTMLMPLCVLISWHSINQRIRSFMAMLLVMEGAMIGVFAALDFVLFYVFWEAMLIPMYLLIGVWGGPNRIYAAVKFFLYTLVGSVLLLVAILALYFQSGHTFDIVQLSQTAVPASLQFWLFLAFFAAFAVKVPMFPFHTWLPDAHVEAPTAGSVILASVLLKMGGYGFVRFSLPMLPDASQAFAPLMVTLSIVAIIYGAYMALSIAHAGYALIGVVAAGVAGTQAGGTNGITAVMLYLALYAFMTFGAFTIVAMLRKGGLDGDEIEDFSGLAARHPLAALLMLVFMVSLAGIPPTAGFIGKFYVFMAAVEAGLTWLAVLALVFAAISAYYYLRIIMVMYMREPDRLTAASPRLIMSPALSIVLACAVAGVVFFGLYPGPLVNLAGHAVLTFK
ncbi:MAG: NADH-quinone oxidoreductase subunit M [Nitrospira sp.]|nr:NADH-quinone oxidoreductase subunit M [Nitrospira sp.]